MGYSTDRKEALGLLAALENGSGQTTVNGQLAEGLDPVLVYIILTYLRESYPASDPAANGVLQRAVELTQAFPTVVAIARHGERDPVSDWFRGEHGFESFRGRGPELVELIIEKLDG